MSDWSLSLVRQCWLCCGRSNGCMDFFKYCAMKHISCVVLLVNFGLFLTESEFLGGFSSQLAL